MAVLIERAPPVKDYDIPSTIVVYILVCLLGVGMCFCLRRANRLLPNQLSFQLRPTNVNRTGSQIGRGYDNDEEADTEARRGLLSEYNDDDSDDDEGRDYDTRRGLLNGHSDNDDACAPSARQERPENHQQQPRFARADDDENEPFGELQSAGTSPTAPEGHEPVTRTPVFNITDEDEDEDEDQENKDSNEHETSRS